MTKVVPYINFVNQGQQAAKFYKQVFGGEAELQLDGDRVIQLDFQAGDIHLMGSDHQSDQIELAPSEGYGLVLNCESEHELHNFYTKLVDGGKAIFAPVDSGWGAIVAHCTDQFGISWMLNYDKP